MLVESNMGVDPSFKPYIAFTREWIIEEFIPC